MKRKMYSTALLMAFASVNAHSTPIFVDHAATGANDGSSWANAYTSLQDGLAAVGFGDEVWVTSGTYYPTRQADITAPNTTTSDPRDATFWIPRNVDLYGGFTGVETNPDQRPAVLSHTVLSGDIGTLGVKSDNAYRVVYYRGFHGGGYGSSDYDQPAPAILDGLRITNAYADTSSGAGIHANGAVIQSSGIALFIPSKISIENCIVEENYSSGNGAGALLSIWSGSIDSSQFYDNASDSSGGGVFVSQQAGSPTIRNTLFSMNSAGTNGGALSRRSDNPGGGTNPFYVAQCKFIDNLADSSGGGISYSASGFSSYPLAVIDCEFSQNEAVADGGGIFLQSGAINLPLVSSGAFGEVH